MIILIIVLIIISLLLVGNHYYEQTMRVKKNKKTVVISETTKEWFNNTNYEDVYITSFDNLKLHGYKINNNSKTTVIIVHGYLLNGLDMLESAYQFYKEGYNILIIDLRGHGLSEGKYVGMGYLESKDLLKWIDYIKTDIILYGISMGAVTVMITIGSNPHKVKLAIEDSGFTNIRDIYKQKIKVPFIISIISLITKIRSNYFFKDVNCLKYLNKTNIPLLLLHGDKDTVVPHHMLNILYENTNSFKEKLVIKDAKHIQSSIKESKLYYETIKEFIKKNNIKKENINE